MNEIKIGNLIISKKGILGIAFLLFTIGVIIGGMVIAPQNGGNGLMALVFIAIVIFINYPMIKKEIREKE